MRDWFNFFIRNNCLHILLGIGKPNPLREADILRKFWKNFQEAYPQHQVFNEAAAGRVSLETAVPLLIHGDEGRGRRHSAHLVLSFHSWLGKGFLKQEKTSKWIKMQCNFLGHSYTTRFLLATMRKRDYADSETFDFLMENLAEEAGFMWRSGVQNREGKSYFGIVLGLAGDWPFLHKSARFSRSFNNVQKRVNLRNPSGGVCHLCSAGKASVPWEQLETRRPEWVNTLFTENPFTQPSPFTAHVLHEPGREAAIWNFDWFHTMHLGVIRNFVGAVLALMSEEEADGNIDNRFLSLGARYQTWCQQNSRRAFITKLTKDLIGWDTMGTYPSATWHRGALSTTMMEFIEARFAQESFSHQPLLVMAAEACEAIQSCSRLLYRSSIWLEPAEAKQCAELGLKFLRRYGQMAAESKQMGRCLFVLQPKIHVLQHFMVDLWHSHQRGTKAVNPLAKSCQQSEDFIGRPSRLSRRVTSQAPVLHRIMDRYLMSTYHHFLKVGYLIRPVDWPNLRSINNFLLNLRRFATII